MKTLFLVSLLAATTTSCYGFSPWGAITSMVSGAADMVGKGIQMAAKKHDPNNCRFTAPGVNYVSRKDQENARRFCLHFGLNKTEGETTDQAVLKRNAEFDACFRLMHSYFNYVDENDEAIDAYADFCKRKNIDPATCGELVEGLKLQCYNMDTTRRLYENLNLDNYVYRTGVWPPKHITLLYKDFELKTFGGENLHNCLQGSAQKKDICDCNVVFGVHKIFNALSMYVGDKFKALLKAVCTNIKQEEVEKFNVWKLRQYERIGDTAGKESMEYLKTFLFKATALAETDWMMDAKSKSWRVERMKEVIELDGPTYKEEVYEVAKAVEYNLEFQFFYDFKSKISQYVNLNDPVCRGRILGSFFDPTTHNQLRNGKFYGNKHIWAGIGKEEFSEVLDMLLEMYKQTEDNYNDCNGFIGLIEPMLDIIYRSNWKKDHVVELFRNAKDKPVNIFKHCLKYSFDVEMAIVKFNLLSKTQPPTESEGKHEWQISDNYVAEFEKFRSKLFQNIDFSSYIFVCRMKLPDYDFNVKENIMNILSFVYQFPEGKYDTVDSVFSNA